MTVDGTGRTDAVTADDFTETLQGFFVMMPVFQPGAKEGLLRGDGIRRFEAEPQGDDRSLHFKGLEVSADEAEKQPGIEGRLGQRKTLRMTGAVGKGEKKVHCRRGASRLRDTSGELFEKTLHDKKERFTLADLVVEIVMGLEELLQFCQSQWATEASGETQPELHALVPKPGGHFLAAKAGEGSERL